VFGWGDRQRRRRFQYNGTAGSRLCRGFPGGVLAAVVSALAISGCSYRLAATAATDDTLVTGSTAPAGQIVATSGQGLPAESDLAYAAAAASVVVAHAGKETSVPWRNPQTGAGGNIMPLDMSFSKSGLPCRDFLASYAHGPVQDWLRGAACRTATGNWEVTRLEPLKSS
jgi:surface antigen